MSTCPDLDLYSAYIDGEVPSPWKEKLEAHLASCPSCKAKVEGYRGLRTALTAHAASPRMPDLDASFARLCARRGELAAVREVHRVHYPEWARFSVKIPLTALAALFLAAVFIPATIVAKLNSGNKAGGTEYAFQQAGLPSGTLTSFGKGLSSIQSVYSPDLPARNVSTQNAVDGDLATFTLVDFAKQYATNRELFSDADIIIIKLPNLTKFNDTYPSAEDPFSSGGTLQEAVGYTGQYR
jgi:hypothetical protein